MKMGSIVNDKGIFDFTTTENFVNNATDAGLSVYGHTLCWHEQQPVKWLSSLIADREIEIDPDQKVEKIDYSLDCGTLTRYDWTGNPESVVTTWGKDGTMEIYNPEPIDPWYLLQYWLVSGISLTEGNEYTLKINMRVEGEGSANIRFKLGNWGGGDSKTFTVPPSADFQEIVLTVNPTMASNGLFFQHGDFAGKVIYKSIEISHSEAPVVEVEQEVSFYTYEDKPDGPFPHYQMGCAPPIVNGALHYEPTGGWSQFFVVPASDNKLEEGNFVFYVDMASNKDAKGVQLTIQNGWTNAQSITVDIPVKEGRHIYTLNYPGVTASPSANYDCILKPQTADATLDFYSLKACVVKKMNSIPLTPEEKKDTLTWAMDKWIKGMMEACDGKVKAFDAINEPVDGWGAPVDGVLPLQHANPEKPDDTKFYWQDYLGDEEYVRTVIKLARQYGPEDIKLFINDYALEGYVVEGKYVYRPKLESLIKWIEKWESDGVTKIDGIGTQMHINCFEDDAENQKMMDGIAESFQKMAATGKFVRVSELDMGYIDASGNSVKTADMTEDGHKKMAKLYNFVVSKYLEIIPPAQQWGICAWGVTDQPTDSYWRPGEPTGLWEVRKVGDESGVYYRKHTYAGFATGLAGQEFEAGK